ncbi:MAG: aspartyl-phosphate phosphatase Spo0E family protein [Bacillota bacterium]|nr:aspartyl-phosphate phosphatase Spo0E family protein [Bacillota bacterium]
MVKLITDIEKCRNEMVRLASHASLADQSVLEASTRLDSLLNKYYFLTTKKNA